MLKLITLSRISKEKGFERMLKMESILEEAGVNFIWDCYGDTTTNYAKLIIPKFKHVKFKGVTDKAMQEAKKYDYIVQLSDTEGFSYSVYEAIQNKIPVIVTDFPSAFELIEDGVNGYIVKKNFTNFDTAKIINNIPVIKTFKEKSTEQDWINFLDMEDKKPKGRKPRATVNTENAKVRVQVIKRYHDTEKDKVFNPGQFHVVTESRLKVLEKANVAKKV